MTRKQLIPLIGKRRLTIVFKHERPSLENYHIKDIGETYVWGDGPGQGQSPLRITEIASVSWTEEKRHTVAA